MKQTTFLLFTLVTCAILCISGCSNSPTSHLDPTDPPIEYFCESCGSSYFESDFCEDRVIVVLRPEFSGVNQEIDEESFRVALSDPTAIKTIVDLTIITNPEVIQNPEFFAQILSIELSRSCKNLVFLVIGELEVLEKVFAAEPSYHYIAIND